MALVTSRYVIHEDVVGKGAWSVVKRCSTIPPYVPRAVSNAKYLKNGDSSKLKYVVKIIEKDYLVSLTNGDVDRAMAEVKREIEVLKHIPASPHLVNFIEDYETDKQFLLIFEEVQCGDLCELILKASNARLDEPRAKKYTYQLIQAVLHCHVHDVIHRDIKPENLLVNADDDIKLTDFGLAKWAKGSSPAAVVSSDFNKWLVSFPGAENLERRRIVCSDVIGTPRYGAPEMFYAKFSQTQYDGYKADTWSVGIVAFILLSGTFPFFCATGATEHETFKTILDTPLPVPTNISADAADFLKRILNKDPLKRLSLADALDHPWFEAVATAPIHPLNSIVQLRASGITAPDVILSQCESEMSSLHLTIAKLRRDLLVQRLRNTDVTPKKPSVGGKDGSVATSMRRAETPTTTTSRARVGTTTPISARLGPSPARPGSATARLTPNVRTSSPAVVGQDASVSRGASTQPTNPSRQPQPAAVRTASPLSRSSPSTQRRGTPLRPTGVNGAVASNTAPNIRPSSAKRSTTPSSTSRVTATRPASATLGTSSAATFHVGDEVVYKKCRAVVHFNGETTFGAGTWIGLEMMEGNEGTNDGASLFDKKRYFTCPKGKGVFVRASQIKLCDSEI